MKISIDLSGATPDQIARFQSSEIDRTMEALRTAVGADDATVRVWGGPYSTPVPHMAVRADCRRLQKAIYSEDDAKTLLSNSSVRVLYRPDKNKDMDMSLTPAQ